MIPSTGDIAGLLFEVAAAPNGAVRRAEYEKLVQRPVKESTWLQAVGDI